MNMNSVNSMFRYNFYNSLNSYSSGNYTKNLKLLQDLATINESFLDKVLNSNDSSNLIVKEDKEEVKEGAEESKNLHFLKDRTGEERKGDNEELIEKIKKEELKLIKEFRNKIFEVKGTNDSLYDKTKKINFLLKDYAYKLTLLRTKEGFTINFKPLIRDVKAEAYFTRGEETIIINNKTNKNILHIRIKKETAQDLINKLTLQFFNILKNTVLQELTSAELKKEIKNLELTKFFASSLINYVPLFPIIFSTKDKYGYIVKKGERCFNVCSVPKINVKFKENGEKWEILETLDILKNKYKRLYILFKNLFREDEAIIYMLNKFAYFLNTYKKWTTAEVIFGVQGAGKGVFAEHFIKKLLDTIIF